MLAIHGEPRQMRVLKINSLKIFKKFQVKKGCGKCPFHTCEECNGHLCNNQTTFPFYCFGFMGSYKKCNKSDCFIAKIEEKNGGVFFLIIC